MAYGTVKVDFITFDNGGADQTIPVSGIANTISGTITVTGLIYGQTVAGVSGLFTTVTGNTVSAITVIGTTVVSGATVTGANINAGTAVNAPTVNATTVKANTISGATITGGSASITGTVSGNQLQGVSGVFTNITGTTVNAVTLSGTTITGGAAGIQGTITASGINATNVSGTNIFGTVVSGATITGDNIYVLNTITGNTIIALSISGNTITGSTVSGTNVFGTVVSGTTITGNSGGIDGTLTAGRVNATFVSGTNISGAVVSGAMIIGENIYISGEVVGSTLSGVTVLGTTLSGVTVTGTDIQGVTVSGTTTVAGGALVPLDSTVPSVGIYLPASDTLGFATSGVSQIQINSQGYINAANLPSSGTALNIRRNLSGNATTAGIASVCFNTATTSVNTYGVYSFITPTPSGSPASPDVHIYYAAGDSGSTYTTPAAQYGYYADSSITQGSSNFGFFSAIPSGTNRYGFYEASGATSAFLGDVGIGTGTPTAKLEVSGNTKLVGDVQVSSVNSGPLAGFRNALVNGNFDFWQRATSQTALGYRSADRWRFSWDGGGTATISRGVFTLGASGIPNEGAYFLNWNQSVAGSGQTSSDVIQRIEGVRTFAGQQVTVSFYVLSSSGTKTLPLVSLGQYFGTGGSPSSLVFTTLSTSVDVSTSWQKVSMTATLPSLSGKTIGTDGNDYLSLLIRMPLNQTYNISLSQIQVELGPVATPFERRPEAIEQTLCERYFIKNTSGFTASQFSGDVTSGQLYQAVTHFSTRMRTTPTVTLTNTAQSSFPVTTGTVTASPLGFQEQRTANATGRGAFLSSFEADAEL